MILNNSFAFFRYDPAASLYVTGEDAFVFLHGQFSNDLRAVREGNGAYGLWLNQKGKVLADSFVVGHGEGFLIFSQESATSVIRERLEAYIIADDVTLEDVGGAWSAVALRGAEDAVQPIVSPETGYIVRSRGAAAWEWFFPRAETARVDQALAGAFELTAEQAEQRRIADGIASVPRDIGPGELPQEGGLDHAVSHQKGCYLGQEVMARLRAIGQVRRRIFRVRAAGPAPARGTPLFQGGRQLGEVRSAVAEGDGFVALALLTTLNLDATRALSLGTAEAEPTVGFVVA